MPKKVRADEVGQNRTAFDKNRAKLLKMGGVCGICGKPVDCSIKDYLLPMAPVIDHIIPISKGGHPSDINNLQLAHRWCNRQKADKLIDIKSRFKEAEKKVRNDDLPLHADWSAYRA